MGDVIQLIRNKLNVWFDLDGVLVDSVGLVEHIISQEFGFPFKHYHYYAGPMNISQAAKKRIRELYDDVAFISQAPPTLHANYVLNKLKQYCNVGILTCRPKTERGMAHTYSQCLSNFGIEPVMVDNADQKVGVLQTMGAHLYIEDCLDNANMIASSGIPCCLLQKLYNQGDTVENVARVTTLLDFEQIVMAMTFGRVE